MTVYNLVGIIYITTYNISFQTKVNNEDPFGSATSSSVNNVVIKKNVLEETSVKSEDVPPALPPKTGTPTRPCPPPPGMRVGIFLKSTEMLFLLLKNIGVGLIDLDKGL